MLEFLPVLSLYFLDIYGIFSTFYPRISHLFSHIAQPTRDAVRELFPLWRFYFALRHNELQGEITQNHA